MRQKLCKLCCFFLYIMYAPASDNGTSIFLQRAPLPPLSASKTWGQLPSPNLQGADDAGLPTILHPFVPVISS